MEDIDLDTLSALRISLVERIGQERFDLWFNSSAQLRLDRDQLFIEAASQFTIDFLRRNFREQIDAAVADTMPGSTVIQYRVSADTSGPRTGKKVTAAVAGVAPVNKVEARQELSRRRKFSSLEQLIVGECNKFASTAASMIMNRPGEINPLFICGPQGSGKTHLLEGIYGEARRSKKFERVVYLSAEQFTTYFLDALNGSGVANFRRKYRDADLLIIDDVQFFAGKRATRTELLHTLDSITRRGGQIVLAADKRPTELSALGPELIARFSGGLVCEVHEIDRDTRRKMAEKLCASRDMNASRGLLDWLADHLPGDARLMSGAMNRLWATAMSLDRPVDVAMAENALADMVRACTPIVRLADIEEVVCKSFGIDAKILRSPSKSRKASHPRMLAMWLARKYTKAALSDICQFFHRKSHSTVISAEKKVNQWIKESKSLQLSDTAIHVSDAIRRCESELKLG
ncbi:DnaA ATPase domain-containing protein [Blastopirellula marina]|uniref:Chromosomal replication initiator protein DnaA n=1 Tax=Blastopirellula marina DSM 3645 TaxID=314230 RepID=A3ZQ28_9BACT|nr:DnaA/Hda family protein [Blastopirellula marina]EAQ81301.1 chromosomal replication initiator protein dnaA [Blastopirellula marina DSM 3645]